MVFFKKPYVVRRYSQPVYVHGHLSSSYEDLKILMDVQTMEDTAKTEPDGAKSIQKLKVFSDWKLLVETTSEQQKSDHLYFQGKWFVCKSCRLSENTPLRHYIATFVECLDQEEKPELAYRLEGLEPPKEQEKAEELEAEKDGGICDFGKSEGADL